MWQGWCVGWSRLLSPGAGLGWRTYCRRVSWRRSPRALRPPSSAGPPGPWATWAPPWRLVPRAEQLDSGVPELPGVLRQVGRARGEPQTVVGDDCAEGPRFRPGLFHHPLELGPAVFLVFVFPDDGHAQGVREPPDGLGLVGGRQGIAWEHPGIGSRPVMVHPVPPIGVVCLRPATGGGPPVPLGEISCVFPAPADLFWVPFSGNPPCSGHPGGPGPFGAVLVDDGVPPWARL